MRRGRLVILLSASSLGLVRLRPDPPGRRRRVRAAAGRLQPDRDAPRRHASAWSPPAASSSRAPTGPRRPGPISSRRWPSSRPAAAAGPGSSRPAPESPGSARADGRRPRAASRRRRRLDRAPQISRAPSSRPSAARGIDWTLGEDAVEFGRATGMDYALFLHAEDSFASTGRVALQVLGIAGCFIGFCAPQRRRRPVGLCLAGRPAGPARSSGSTSSRPRAMLPGVQFGDIRTPDGAAQMVERLLGRMKAGATSARLAPGE